MTRPSLPAIPVELLPRPRLIVWHGEPGDDPTTDNALAVIRRTYHGVIGHGVVTGGRTAGGNDWSGWHFPDPEAIAGLAGLVDAIAPSHWTIVAEPVAAAAVQVVTRPGDRRPVCPDCGHVHAGVDLGQICVGCPCLSVPAIVGELDDADVATTRLLARWRNER